MKKVQDYIDKQTKFHHGFGLIPQSNKTIAPIDKVKLLSKKFDISSSKVSSIMNEMRKIYFQNVEEIEGKLDSLILLQEGNDFKFKSNDELGTLLIFIPSGQYQILKQVSYISAVIDPFGLANKSGKLVNKRIQLVENRKNENSGFGGFSTKSLIVYSGVGVEFKKKEKI
eukprot:gene2026-1533_t